jgi:hypothetical protein
MALQALLFHPHPVEVGHHMLRHLYLYNNILFNLYPHIKG